MLSIDVLTIFPNMFESVLGESIIKRGIQKGLFEIKVHNLRNWSKDVKHGKVDDTPYGGGPGMVMMVEPIYEALRELRKENSYVILLSAGGNTYTQRRAEEFKEKEHIILICGHYEGVDQRVSDFLIDEEISIGNYVLTGGEIPAMAIIDSTIRLIPGVLGNEASLQEETFSLEEGEAEYPQYTKPAVFQNWTVPDILLSGNHKEIEEWRKTNRRRK